MKNIIPTVTVGLAAFNESANIGNLIESILGQKEMGFKLEQIIINSDGSIDNTVNIIKSFKNPKVKVIDNKDRRGQPYRMGQIYKMFNSDYFIQTDADTLFSNDKLIYNFVKVFEKDKSIMMCGGHVKPLTPKNLIQRAVYTSTEVYRNFSENLNSGNNLFTVHGPLMAFRRKYIKEIKLPSVIANDKYLYLNCIRNGYKYKYVKKSVIFFELPLTVKDQIKQNARFKAAKKQLYQHFDKEFLDKEYRKPENIYKLFINAFLADPIAVFFIFIVNKYSRLVAFFKSKSMSNILWEKLERTKVVVK